MLGSYRLWRLPLSTLTSISASRFPVFKKYRAFRGYIHSHSHSPLHLHSRLFGQMRTINAIQYTGAGGPEVIKSTSVPVPVAQPNEFLIRVKYGGVNFIDTYYRTGTYAVKEHPWTAGSEAAGIIERLPSDPAVLEDPEYQKRNYQIGQKVVVISGPAYAELITKPWTAVIPVPDSIDVKTAAAAATQGLTALSFISEAYKAEPDDYVLVHAAAGGLGLALCQLLKARGAHVIGSVSSEVKANLAKENGAEFVIIYTKEDLIKRVNEITGGEGVHGIYDGVGKTTWEGNFQMIRRKGTIVSIGNASGVVPPFSPIILGAKNLKVCRPVVHNYLQTAKEVNHYYPQLWQLVESGAFKIHIYKEYTFTQEGVAEAQTEQASGKTTGKLVIKVAD